MSHSYQILHVTVVGLYQGCLNYTPMVKFGSVTWEGAQVLQGLILKKKKSINIPVPSHEAFIYQILLGALSSRPLPRVLKF